MTVRITYDHLSVEHDLDDPDRWRVVAWAADGVPCTVDTGLTIDEAHGLRTALKATIESWAALAPRPATALERVAPAYEARPCSFCGRLLPACDDPNPTHLCVPG